MADNHRIALTRRDWLAAGSATMLAGLALPAIGEPEAANARVRLNLNENAFGPSPRVAQAIAANLKGLERYVEQVEVDALVAQIARLEQVRPDQIVIGEVLEPLGLHLARKRTGGGTFVYSAPGYTALIDAAEPLGGVGVAVPLNSRLENDLPALGRAIDGRTLAVNLVNPHNPSGTVNDRQALDAFIRETAKRTLVVVDEAYLEYDDLAQRSAIRLVREGLNVLVFRTLAKIYGLAGLSIGYAVTSTKLAADLRAAGIGAPHSLSRLALVAASAALGDQSHVRAVRGQSVAERTRITQALDTLGIEHSNSAANFVFFRTPAFGKVRAAFDAHRIEVGRPFPPLDEWIRVTVGLPKQNDAALKVLREALGR
ncbi:MAG: class and aminotransferase [Sphingomonadales bacterium]|nr:class and aminotransferase [Sphingomonadales bacterium]